MDLRRLPTVNPWELKMEYEEQSFASSAAKQLTIYALIALVAISILFYFLSLAAARVGGAVTAGAIDVEQNKITIALRQEPPQLDHTRATDSVSFTVLSHSMEGLLTYNDENQLSPGVAERWEVREDGATFWLRDDSYWSDGSPVTAHDFEFAWKKVVDPQIASVYAFIMYPIKNAEAINSGDLPPSTLGVTAVDDKTLEISFEQPTPYFEKLVAFVTFLPAKQEFYESTNGRYGADADQLLYNGAYLVTEWIHSASMRWEKNQNYWNKEEVGFVDVIEVGYITEDVNAKLNMFKDGQIPETQLVASMLGNAMEQRWQIDRFMEGNVFWVVTNFRDGRATQNYNFRKALQLSIDPVEFVYKALKEPGYLPGVSMFPSWISGVEGFFRDEYPPIEHTPDPEQARRHLEIAKQELGLEEIGPIVLLADDTPVGNLTAEYLQAVFAEELGLEVRIDKQIFKQRLLKAEAGEFDILVNGWSPDYDDALTFGDYFSSWNLSNRGRYNNPELDKNVRIGQSSLDQRTRMEAFAEIQRITYEDGVVFPLYERGWSFVVNPMLKGFKRRVIGPEVDFRFAYIDQNAADM
jgi:oligopeptide transport system substrate-binding protein